MEFPSIVNVFVYQFVEFLTKNYNSLIFSLQSLKSSERNKQVNVQHQVSNHPKIGCCCGKWFMFSIKHDVQFTKMTKIFRKCRHSQEALWKSTFLLFSSHVINLRIRDQIAWHKFDYCSAQYSGHRLNRESHVVISNFGC